TVIYTLSLHDALPIYYKDLSVRRKHLLAVLDPRVRIPFVRPKGTNFDRRTNIFPGFFRKGRTSEPQNVTYPYNSSNILVVCSPNFGEPFEEINSSPSIRIGQRVVSYVNPSPIVTCCTISNILKPSCSVNRCQSNTSAHHISAASKIPSQ